MKIYSLLFLLFSGTFLANENAKAQSASINTTGSAPDVKAMLDVKSITQGFLPPRLTTAQRSALATKLTIAQRGMEIADASTGKIFYWSGTQWKQPSLYSGTDPISVSTSLTNEIALNPGTQAGDLITWDGNNWVNMQPDIHFSFTLDNRQPTLAINYCIAIQGLYPSQTSSDLPFLGELELFAFSFEPRQFKYCNGQLLSTSLNMALFQLLGTTYGGDGVNTFGLPDLSSRVPIGFQQGTGLSSYALGAGGGVDSVTLIH